jgi:hypothetical protein
MLDMDALRPPEIKELIQASYQLILEKLPKNKQADLRQRQESSLQPRRRKLNRGGL